MKFETWSPTTYLFWAALLVIVFVTTEFAVTMVALVAFFVSMVWQLVQWIIIRRQQRNAHLEDWNYKG